MQALVPVALIAWVPVCLILFIVFPRRVAVVTAIVGAWLFLPPSSIPLGGLPDYSKVSAFTWGILLASLIFCPDRFAALRFSPLDIPVVIFCTSSMATSLVNGLGPYDGLSTCIGVLNYWGLPYLVGRIHFSDAASLRDLTVGIVVGGLIYMPLCWIEMTISPIIASKVYALRFYEDVRLGGARPRVFLSRGLELGMWMSVTSLCALWLWRSRNLDRLLGLSFGRFWLPLLLLTTVLCRASGAIGLLGVGVAVLWLSTRFNTRLPMLALIAATFVYVGVRGMNTWDYRPLISFLSQNFDRARAQSLEFRFQNEDLLVRKAMERPILGWGGWGRSRVYSDSGKDLTITDGLWIIFFGTSGFVGLLSFQGLLLGPALMFTLRYPARRWTEPDLGTMAAISAFLGIYSIDCLLNAFPNAAYAVAAGGLVARLRSGDGGSVESAGDEAAVRAALAGASSGPAPEAPLEVRLASRYIAMARSSRAAGDLDEAAAARRHALELLAGRLEVDPSDASAARLRLDCLNDLAWLLATRPDPGIDERGFAAELAREAVAASPDDPTYWNTLALALCRAGDHAGAATSARRSMELDSAWNGYDMAVLAIGEARAGLKEEAARWVVEAARWHEDRGGFDPTLDELIAEAQAALA
ncbi:tetratricopeptide repeat protein [Paludisphaera soli]|uniref:tetratricopeptide repeat protein n=1 Tax=Paludisphaera soli TaxID=2712865 RepID=UPI0013EAAA69|nr:bacterial transcriptional activator domain-containing protein [Paludisphaera soli]